MASVSLQFTWTSAANSSLTPLLFDIVGSDFVGYGWKVISGSIPVNYICEISRDNAGTMNTIILNKTTT